MNWIIIGIVYCVLLYLMLGFFRVSNRGSYNGHHEDVINLMKEENDKKSRGRK